jgi:hypothetical protein
MFFSFFINPLFIQDPPPQQLPLPASPDKRFVVASSSTAAVADLAAAADGDYDDDMEEGDDEDGKYSDDPLSSSSLAKGKRGRPRKHAPKIPLPPLYVFIREAPAAAAILMFLKRRENTEAVFL